MIKINILNPLQFIVKPFIFVEVMETEEKERIRREKLGEYFFNLSNTVCGSAVIGALALLLSEQDKVIIYGIFALLIAGLFGVVFLALLGNEYLKK